MEEISTPFILHSDIETKDIDIFEDAYGFDVHYRDVINMVKKAMPKAPADVTERLIAKVRSTINFG